MEKYSDELSPEDEAEGWDYDASSEDYEHSNYTLGSQQEE